MLEQVRDTICVKFIEFCKEAWPDNIHLPGSLNAFYSLRREITYTDNFLLRWSRIIIPSYLMLEVLDMLHEGNQGIAKCQERTKQSGWWSGWRNQMYCTVVYKCHTCTHGGHKKREPLITSEYPSRPWEIVSADLFDCKDIFAGGRLLLFKICQNC